MIIIRPTTTTRQRRRHDVTCDKSLYNALWHGPPLRVANEGLIENVWEGESIAPPNAAAHARSFGNPARAEPAGYASNARQLGDQRDGDESVCLAEGRKCWRTGNGDASGGKGASPTSSVRHLDIMLVTVSLPASTA